MRMTVKEVAEDMGIPIQAVRVLAQNGKLPFILTTKTKKTHSYYAIREQYELWKMGKLRRE